MEFSVDDNLRENAAIMAESFKEDFMFLKDDVKTAFYPMVRNKELYIPKIESFSVATPGIVKVEGLIDFLENVLISIERIFSKIGDLFHALSNRAVFSENIRLVELKKIYPIVLNAINDPSIMGILKTKQVNVVVGLNTEMKKFLEELEKILKDVDKNFTEGLKLLDKRVAIFMSDKNVRTADIVPKNRDFEKYVKIELEYSGFIQKHIDPYDLEESKDFTQVFPNIRYLSDCIETIQATGKFIVVKNFNKYKEEVNKVYQRINDLVKSIKANKIVVTETATNALIENVENIANVVSYGSSICFLYIQAINSLIGASYLVKDFRK